MYGRLLVFAALAAPCAMRGAGDSQVDRETLRGLKAVNVIIDQIHPELERQGLTRESLQTRLEERLQEAGISVDRNALEFLALRILPAQEKKGSFCISVRLGVYQPVMLVRDNKIRTATETWEVATLWALQPKALEFSTRSAVDQLADRFVEVYRAINPK
jgi:hypothetical protein